MKILNKILCFVLPSIMCVAIALWLILPNIGTDSPRASTTVITGGTLFSGQVEFVDTDTGASEAAKEYKGGAIFLEPGSTYEMGGGTISGHSNVYGGAIYVCAGATFIMYGGTIKDNSATYGGAIYVERDANCIIEGGTFTGNSASRGPAIMIEDGAHFEIDTETGSVEFTDNKSEGGMLTDEKLAGWLGESKYDLLYGRDFGGGLVSYKTMRFGSFPQRYVGEDMNERLEQWYNVNQPEPVADYENYRNTWHSYAYPNDGNIYVRVISDPSNINYGEPIYANEMEANGVDTKQVAPPSPPHLYKNDAEVKQKGEYAWFCVEPIVWYMLNYDEWESGKEPLKLISEVALTSNMIFNVVPLGSRPDNTWENSKLRAWLNGNFYETAFTEEERGQIAGVKLTNNTTEDFSYHGLYCDSSYWSGTTTYDNVYFLSYEDIKSSNGKMYDMSGDLSNLDYLHNSCSVSDYALSNHCGYIPDFTTDGLNGICGSYWLRNSGWDELSGIQVNYLGISIAYNNIDELDIGIRPCITVNL